MTMTTRTRRQNAGEDRATLTGASLLRRPRNLLGFAVSYVVLMCCWVCLTCLLRLNDATGKEFSDHWRASIRLYMTRVLLNQIKDR